MKFRNVVLIFFSFVVLSYVTYFITVNNYESYVKNNNDVVLKLINEMLVDDLSEDEIIEIINGNYVYEENVLNKYGYDLDELFLIDLNEDVLTKNVVLNIFFVNLVLVIIYIFVIGKSLKNKSEFRNIENYLIKINNGDYSLELNNEKESDLASLKNELYKTTICLKESSNKLLKEKNLIKNNLADISHQLKTPLAGIMVLTENILDDPDMDDAIKLDFLNDIKNKAFNIEFLILNLLKLSKFDADVIIFNKDVINVNELINDAINNVNYLIKEKNISVKLFISNEISFIGDYNWQLEAMTNIVKNSLEYSDFNSCLEICVMKNNFYTEFEIKDYGIGIKKDDIKNIFNRFYKGEKSLSNNIGIGLNLAKTIISKDNGMIDVKSKEGEGTIFTIKYFEGNK